MALITVLWALVGYSLCFGGKGPVIGGFEHAFLRASRERAGLLGNDSADDLSWCTS